MKVEYTLTPEDYAAAVRDRVRDRPARSRLLHYLGVGAILLLLLSQVARFVAKGAPLPLVAGVSLFLVVLVFVFLPPFRRQIRRWLLADAPATSMSVEVRPEGLSVTTETTASLTTWEGIERIEVGDTHAFFYSNNAVARILPRRAFAQGRDFEEFVERARSYQEAAKRSCG